MKKNNPLQINRTSSGALPSDLPIMEKELTYKKLLAKREKERHPVGTNLVVPMFATDDVDLPVCITDLLDAHKSQKIFPWKDNHLYYNILVTDYNFYHNQMLNGKDYVFFVTVVN